MKIAVIRPKSRWLWVLLALWAAALVTVIVLTAAKPAMARAKQKPVYAVQTEEKKLAITFNAAWGDETTDGVLRVLEDAGVKATFFFVGTFAQQYPESVKKIANAGHEIANHSMTHTSPRRLSYEENLREIKDCADLLFSLTGRQPALYRAPSGEYTDALMEAAASLGNTVVQWSADSIDWKDPSPAQIVERIAAKAAPGGILLFHLGKQNTLDALGQVLADLQAQGYTFVPVSQLLLPGETFVDANGVQRPAPGTGAEK